MASSQQIEEFNSDFSLCRIDDQQETARDDIRSRLKLLNIHFNWSLHQTRPDGPKSEILVSELKRKLKEMLDSSNSEFTFQSFCCQLTMAQELIKYDTASALEKVLECEPWVMSLKSDTCQENEFFSIREAVEYIYIGCKAFVLFTSGYIVEAEKVLSKIPDLENMEEIQKSGIYAVKACAFMQYGLPGFEKALEYISIARSKHPKMAEWHFLTGKLMTRIRHIKRYYTVVESIDAEEKFYRTAYELDRNEPSYALYVAQITREKACRLFHECRYDREAQKNSLVYINRMHEESLSLYTELIETYQNDSFILGRCAFGIVKLPWPYKRLDLAVNAIEQALKISPENPLINHYAGLIYHRNLKDDAKGLKYFARAANKGNYAALMDFLRLKLLLDPKNYDPLPELNKALEYTDFIPLTLSEIGSWYFFKKLNIFSAWDHLQKITDDHYIRNYRSVIQNMKYNCNMYEVIFDEVKLMIAECKYKDKQEREKLMSIHEQLQILCPQSHSTSYVGLKSMIMNNKDSNSLHFSQRGSGNGRMRPDTQACGKGESAGNWRSSTGNINRLVCNSLSIHREGKTYQWRKNDPKYHEISLRNNQGSLNCSRDSIHIHKYQRTNVFACKTSDPHSWRTTSTRNVSPSEDQQ
ncbi:uncharacterized protein LOC111046566 [Nilaparvata lugens]|uniref:uncharacterized protein LOC111046566 n=1 Tax=Nilaparvata lugens TaxID=108931 RepID=UPI00193CEBFE|nr:uncharacterized protein LOC111046566 [Nilaparvata lugens]